MKTSKPKKPKHEAEVFERLVGGDGAEFTVVCHPAAAEGAQADIKSPQQPDLVCKIIETKDKPAK